jgi:N-acyl-D-amino-acid deacylase
MLDILIHGGTLIDGTGAPRRRADVGIRGGTVVAVGELQSEAAHRRIDAQGLIVAPGFIDCHTHDDLLLLEHPAAHPKLLQGVTTVVSGNCGVSLAPMAPGAPPSLLSASIDKPAAPLRGTPRWRPTWPICRRRSPR